MSNQNKTQPTKVSVDKFIESISDDKQKSDSIELIKIMKEISGMEPVMWGESIVGFGNYHYKYDSGREGDMAILNFSPRKDKLTVYVMNGTDAYTSKLKALGPHKTGKVCLYIKSLDQIDIQVLKEILIDSFSKFK